MDSVMSPKTAIQLGKLGGLGVLDLEGLWTRYEDPTSVLEQIASLPADEATRRMQEVYAAEIPPELITERLAEIRESGVVVAGSLSPQRTQPPGRTGAAAGVELFAVRRTTVSGAAVLGAAQR